jgi:hypothetical protein
LRIELTPEQAATLRPLLDDQNPFDRQLIIGQVMKGNWPEPEKTFLLCTTINSTTGEKIRKLIQKERAGARTPGDLVEKSPRRYGSRSEG